MNREKFVEEKSWEIQESILREYSPIEEKINDYNQFSELFTKTAEVIYLMKVIRDKYKDKKLLPIFPANSIWEDMITIVDYIEEQALLFGEPVIVKKDYIEVSKQEIDKIKENPFELEMSGLKAWVEENLI